MLVVNFTELINNHKIDAKNYFICSSDLKKKLTKRGFSPISLYEDKYVFVKDSRLMEVLENLEESEVDFGFENESKL